MSLKTLIVVPARYGSTRFPGKPLAKINGVSMVVRVARRAEAAARALDNATYVVATDDQRIADHCRDNGYSAVLTDAALPSGSDRALAAARAVSETPRFIVNLQGDAPFTPPDHITAIVAALEAREADAATPCVRLDWAGLDALREAKKTSPFSGTTCLVGEDGEALWFSKTILPTLRNEDALRRERTLSPVRQHIGLYAFQRQSLQRFADLPSSPYEKLEGLEQLRLLENRMSLLCVEVAPARFLASGVDTPEDLARVEALIAANGDPDRDI